MKVSPHFTTQLVFKNEFAIELLYGSFFLQIFGHISGSHLNPAVTLAAVILELLDYMTAIYYVVGQFAGAIFGFGLIKVITTTHT